MIKKTLLSLTDGGPLACCCSMFIIICDMFSLFAKTSPDSLIYSRLRISVLCTLVLVQGIRRSLLICIPFLPAGSFAILGTYIMHCVLLLGAAFDMALNGGFTSLSEGMPKLLQFFIYGAIVINMGTIFLFLIVMLVVTLISACRQTEPEWFLLRNFFERLQNEIDRISLDPQLRPMNDFELIELKSFSVPLQQELQTCAICLGDVGEGERGLKGSVCSHLFHAQCLREWLKVRSACPVCKSTMRNEERTHTEPFLF